MKICLYCGTKNRGEAHCYRCGTDLNITQEEVDEIKARDKEEERKKSAAKQKREEHLEQVIHQEGGGGYFSFRKMISRGLIKFAYSIGMVVITIISIVMIIGGGQSKTELLLFGLLLLVFGNLFWRIICESTILIFSIHEVLVSIERKIGK